MTKFKFLTIALALTAVSSTAFAEQVAEKTDAPVKAVSSVLRQVQARDDFGRFGAIRYNRQAHSYVMWYTATNGDKKIVTINAVTGKVNE